MDDAKSAWHKLFGSFSDINQSGVLGTLTKENYSQTFLTLGDACGPIRKGYVSTIVRATENEEEISIYESDLFITNKSECGVEQGDEEYQYYFDIDRAKETTEANCMANYRRIFKKDTDGHYYFYAIERLV